MRFVEHTIPALKARYGLKSVDVAMPSHMHDDHLNGFPYLVRHHGTKIWCYDNMVDILENPRGNNLGCTLGEVIKVDRSFRHGETFKWEEFEFEICHSPGHTEFQMALFAEIDGARIAFTGDAVHPADAGAPYQLRHSLIFRNWRATATSARFAPFWNTNPTSSRRVIQNPTLPIRPIWKT